MKFLACLLLLAAAAPAAERVPWTTSHVEGSPEPPRPYRVERAFPRLTFATPIETSTIPGTKRVAVLELKGRLFSFPADESIAQADLMADFTKYDSEVVEAYGFTFHPQFAENRYVFVWINLAIKSGKSRPNGSRLVRFRVTEEAVPQLDLTTGKVVYEWMYGGHNGGNLRFGPDGMLYFGTGDGGFAHPADERGSGQDITSQLSKIMRIDVDHPSATKPFGIPQDNPFVATPGARGEIWAYGVRNPWRLSFDAKTGALWVGDVGWELWESVIRVERGGNYGWSITEGSKQAVWPDRPRGPTPILPPTWAHSHEESVSITGGEVYYGEKLPELAGAYVYADWQFGTFWSLRAGSAPVEICRSTIMPVGFGIGADGEPLICDYGASGGLWRLARNPAATNPTPFPTRLSETGLFSDVAQQTPAPGVEPFAINAPRWADHATAERWAGFPGTSGITVAPKAFGVLNAGRWVFPAGAVLAKTYSIELEEGNPQTRRALETQLLHFDGAQWAAYSYRWNDAQTDAELVPARGAERTLEIKDTGAPGGLRKQTWRYFSRTECLRCHNLQANTVAGFTPLQLDRPVPAAEGGQLERLARLGLAPLEEPRFADPFGARGSLEVRARSYLHANCSGCHREHGGGSVPSVLNIETPLKSAALLGAKPVQGDLGLSEGRVIAPGRPAQSVLLYRMATAGRGHMPYLGARLVDDRGVLLIRDWIAGLPAPSLPPAARAAEEAESEALAKLAAGDTAPLPALLGTSSGALSVALAILDGTLAGAVRQQAIAQGSALADPLRRDLFERFLPESQRRRVLGPDIHPEALLTLRGDAARGQPLFATLCTTCHRIGETGIDFGPDLSHIATKYHPPALLEQILLPSKIVEPAWQLATLTLTGGEVLSGFITARTDTELTLRLAGGVTQKVATKLVMKTEMSRTSLMPEGLLQTLTAQEAADLLAFLAAQK